MVLDFKRTIDLMNSDNYRDRLVAEYLQLRIRIKRLKRYLADYEMREPNKEYINLLRHQLMVMGLYREVLEKRLKVENIEF